MLLVVGSYEQMLLGYSLVHDSQSDSRIEAKASFTDHSHNGYVKTLASSKNVLASGSTDERIWLVIFTFKDTFVAQTQAILFLKSMSKRVGSDIERLWI